MCVDTHVDVVDEENYKFHRSKALTMDLGDMSIPRTDFNISVNEGMPILETNDDEFVPSVNVDPIVQALEVAPL